MGGMVITYLAASSQVWEDLTGHGAGNSAVAQVADRLIYCARMCITDFVLWCFMRFKCPDVWNTDMIDAFWASMLWIHRRLRLPACHFLGSGGREMAPPEAVGLVDPDLDDLDEDSQSSAKPLALVLFSVLSVLLLFITVGTIDLNKWTEAEHRKLNEDDFFTPFDYEAALNPTTTPNPEEGSMIPYMEKGMEFAGATRLVWRNVLIPSECCARCQNDARCRVWVLDSETHECSLKWVEPNATLEKVPKKSLGGATAFPRLFFMALFHLHPISSIVIYGELESREYWWTGLVSATRNYISGLPFKWSKKSVLCFAVMRPDTYEQGLIAWQYRNKALSLRG